jgi:hypothetical protein
MQKTKTYAKKRVENKLFKNLQILNFKTKKIVMTNHNCQKFSETCRFGVFD